MFKRKSKDTQASATQESSEQEKKQPSFLQSIGLLPSPLLSRFLKTVLIAAIIGICSIVCTIVTRQWEYTVLLLISAYLFYLALNLLWRYSDGKIVCKPMVCIKAVKVKTFRRMFILLQETDAPSKNPRDTLHSYYVPASAKEIALMTPNTLLDVYYDPNTPAELICYQITGNAR